MRALFCIVIALFLSGCQSLGSNLVDGVESQIRLKWAEEWKPSLIAETKGMISEVKKETLRSTVDKIEKFEQKNEARLARIDVQVEKFDVNGDNRVTGLETLALLKEIKEKNSKSDHPLTWWEILLAVAGAYIPLTSAKEIARRKMGTGNGAVKPA